MHKVEVLALLQHDLIVALRKFLKGVPQEGVRLQQGTLLDSQDPMSRLDTPGLCYFVDWFLNWNGFAVDQKKCTDEFIFLTCVNTTAEYLAVIHIHNWQFLAFVARLADYEGLMGHFAGGEVRLEELRDDEAGNVIVSHSESTGHFRESHGGPVAI